MTNHDKTLDHGGIVTCINKLVSCVGLTFNTGEYFTHPAHLGFTFLIDLVSSFLTGDQGTLLPVQHSKHKNRALSI